MIINSYLLLICYSLGILFRSEKSSINEVIVQSSRLPNNRFWSDQNMACFPSAAFLVTLHCNYLIMVTINDDDSEMIFRINSDLVNYACKTVACKNKSFLEKTINYINIYVNIFNYDCTSKTLTLLSKHLLI